MSAMHFVMYYFVHRSYMPSRRGTPDPRAWIRSAAKGTRSPSGAPCRAVSAKLDPLKHPWTVQMSKERETYFIAVIIGGGPHINIFSPLPCVAEPKPPVGTCFSIISLVTNPTPSVQPDGGLLRQYCEASAKQGGRIRITHK